TGFYSAADYYPVFHATCITHRKDMIYPATIVGKPPMEDCYMAKATERIFLPLIKLDFPEIKDINLPMEGVFHNCALISIKKSYPGHARKIIHGLWGSVFSRKHHKSILRFIPLSFRRKVTIVCGDPILPKNTTIDTLQEIMVKLRNQTL
ncbi:MAG: UbiD family decarboxylase domain-containing protein, partial [Burkholderiales bacterium]